MRRLALPLALLVTAAMWLLARHWVYYPYALTFGLSVSLTMLFSPLARSLAIRYGAVDRPDARKVHTEPMPRWGGLAIYLSFFLSLGFILFFFLDPDMQTGLSRLVGGLTGATDAITIGFQKEAAARLNLLGLLLGGTVMVVVGMIDDRFNLAARQKLLGQILTACILVACGITINFVRLPHHAAPVYLENWVTAVGTVIWIVGITNAVNLLDGLDGLLAGVAAISAAFLFVISLAEGQYLVALILAALSGATLGFLRDNFNPARIFMGDTGSLFIGVLFGALSVMGSLKTPTTMLAILSTACILGLPILDTSLAIIRRASKGVPIFSPDKEHLHHKLLAMNLTQRQVVLLIYTINGILGLTGLYVVYFAR